MRDEFLSIFGGVYGRQERLPHMLYPPGTIDAKGPIVNARVGYHHSWTIQILPYLARQRSRGKGRGRPEQSRS